MIAAILMIGAIGCKKDEKNLKGTSWTFVGTANHETIKFTSKSDVKVTGVINSVDYSAVGNYNYTPPAITIILEGGNVFTGYINGNVLSITSGSSSVIYTRD